MVQRWYLLVIWTLQGVAVSLENEDIQPQLPANSNMGNQSYICILEGQNISTNREQNMSISVQTYTNLEKEKKEISLQQMTIYIICKCTHTPGISLFVCLEWPLITTSGASLPFFLCSQFEEQGHSKQQSSRATSNNF